MIYFVLNTELSALNAPLFNAHLLRLMCGKQQKYDKISEIVLCIPEAPISAVNPSTVETGSSRPFSTDSSKLPSRLFLPAMVAGAEVESNRRGSLIQVLSVEIEKTRGIKIGITLIEVG